VTIEVDDYTALVGPNGSGKSSVLYALDWFFNGTAIDSRDFHTTSSEPSGSTDKEQEIDIEVTFGHLDDEDRRVLAEYGRGETVRFRRTWSRSSASDKMIGNSRQGPGFASIRADNRVTFMRPIYNELRETYPELAAVTGKDEIIEQLSLWENDPQNVDKLEEIKACDATHLFGFNGENVLARRIRMVLVPGSADIADEMAPKGKSSAAARLIGALMAEAVSSAKSKWEEDNAPLLEELSGAIRAGVEASTRAQALRVNGIFGTLVKDAKIDFVPEIPEWAVKGEASVQTDVVIDGERKDVSRQGHGIQRAVIIAMLQALVPDEESVRAAADEKDSEVTTQELAELPALVICIEEPEIYQHPVRSRHFARVLSQWADRGRSQVLLATHSPYFVLPSQFQSLRRFSLTAGVSKVTSARFSDIASAIQSDAIKVERVIEKEIPHTFSEGFFAEAVVFVEGDTDRVVVETLAERLDMPLDAAGIAVLAVGGKGNLRIPFELLRLVGVPVYVMADGDALGAKRKHLDNKKKEAKAAASHKDQTEKLLAWLPDPGAISQGVVPASWGAPTVIAEQWSVLHDDLETELEQWPDLVAEFARNGESLRSKRVAAYRGAVGEADLSSLPAGLMSLIETVAAFGAKGSS